MRRCLQKTVNITSPMMPTHDVPTDDGVGILPKISYPRLYIFRMSIPSSSSLITVDRNTTQHCGVITIHG